MTDQKYTLTYFNFRARAELARLLFAVAGIEYEDERVPATQWLKRKPVTPYGQLPTLRVDGTVICQSIAIARYLSREFGLDGDTNLARAKADMVVDCVMDMLDPIQPCYREKNENRKVQMRRDYEDLLPDFLEKLEKMLISNKGGNGYFVGDEVTWADLAVMNAWHWIPGFGVHPPLESYPKLLEHREKIEELPRVADWLDRRPQTPV